MPRRGHILCARVLPLPQLTEPAFSEHAFVSFFKVILPAGFSDQNAFGNKITQPMMVDAMEALVAKNRTINGKPGQSLCGASWRCCHLLL